MASSEKQKGSAKSGQASAVSFLDVDEGNEVFGLGGRGNDLNELGKRVLQNTLNRKTKRVEPYENAAPGRPVLLLDFHEERRRCLRKKILFEDPEFPASISSLNPRGLNASKEFLPEDIKWLRPGQIVSHPQFVVSGCSRFDTKQGKLGDCYTVGSFATLAVYEELFYRVVPLDQSFTENYAGIFHFQFWHYGKWVDVVIDDRLPTIEKRLIYMQTTSRNEFWSALLEKAYAKLYGSYEVLESSLPREVMKDLTGGFILSCDTTRLTEKELLRLIIHSMNRGTLINLSLSHSYSDYGQPISGLYSDHAYCCTGVAKKRVRFWTSKYISMKQLVKRATRMQQGKYRTAGEVNFVRIRNIWGSAARWESDWVGSKDQWRLVSNRDKEQLKADKAKEGEFWMTFHDFVREFSLVEICFLGGRPLAELAAITGQPSVIKNSSIWSHQDLHGCWSTKNGTASGFERGTWMNNPQYALHILANGYSKSGISARYTVLIDLIAKDEPDPRQPELAGKGITIARYKDAVPCNGDGPQKSDEMDLIFQSRHISFHDMTARLELQEGRYLVIISMNKSDEQGEFLLRFLVETNFSVSEIGESMRIKPGEPQTDALEAQLMEQVTEFGGTNLVSKTGFFVKRLSCF